MTQRRDDSLYVKDTTDVDEIVRYVRDRATNPITYDGYTIWNFSSYEFDEDVFTAKNEKELVIPFELQGTWAFMYSLLPDKIRRAEVLVYREQNEEYVAFQNFYRQMPPVRQEEVRSTIAKEIGERDWYE